MLLTEQVEIAEHVERNDKKYKYRSKHLCPAGKKSVDGARLVLREVRIRRTCDNREKPLVTILIKATYNQYT